MTGFYDNTPALPEALTPAHDPASTASVLYGKPEPVADKTPTAEVQAARAADVGRALYATESMFKDTGLDGIEGLDHVAAAEVLRDLGADPKDARELAVRVHALPQATAEDHERWIRETGRISPGDMALARNYLKTDPRARAFIERHPGLEYEPETVKRVISLAKAAAINKRTKP